MENLKQIVVVTLACAGLVACGSQSGKLGTSAAQNQAVVATVECAPPPTDGCAPPPPECNCGCGCTVTQGYWKNHTDWPTDSIVLGGQTYTAAQALAILKLPVKGNGAIALAHQLIAARVNVANGAASIPEITEACHALAVACNGTLLPECFVAPGELSSYVDILTSYNEGAIGPGHCTDE